MEQREYFTTTVTLTEEDRRAIAFAVRDAEAPHGIREATPAEIDQWVRGLVDYAAQELVEKFDDALEGRWPSPIGDSHAGY
jgi:hypothetical protein